MIIRASSLPIYSDCQRRWAARHLDGLSGELRQVPVTIGAAVGTGVHEAQYWSLMSFMEGREPLLGGDAEGIALDALRAETERGVAYDDTSPNLGTAEKQVARMTRMWRAKAAPVLRPLAVEEELRVELRSGHVLSGHLDIREERGITDTKTGTVRRSALAQQGCYSLLARKHGHGCDRVTRTFIPRVRLQKPQPEPDHLHVPAPEAEREALSVIAHIENALARWDETSDPGVFLANPNSMMCGDRYCPAHGTTWCSAWRK